MRKTIYFLFMLAAMTACKNDETHFQPAVGAEAFSFKAMPGGAVMHYQFPVDKELMGLNVRYKDYSGKEILRSGSALGDSIVLEGFNEARQNVPAEVRFVKRDGEESDPVTVNFNTEDSAPYAFFNGVKVLSGWNGFSVITDNSDKIIEGKGMAHIYYLGTDPLSGNPDTILVKSVNIEPGKDTLNFQLKQAADVNTIVIRTEDYRGYMVREQSWPGIASYNTGKLDPSKFDFYCDKGIEDEEYCIGKKYLFDGDLKGMGWFDNCEKYGKAASYDKLNFFLAGPEAVGEPMYIDMHANKITSEVRLYTPLFVRYDWAAKQGKYYSLFRNTYYVDKLPCEVMVYAAKDDHGTPGNWDAKAWELVSKYKQDPDIETDYRWNANAVGYRNEVKTREKAEKADPVYLPLGFLCETQGDGYRYLKIVVNNVYNDIDNGSWWQFGTSLNTARYFLIQELEVWTKKED